MTAHAAAAALPAVAFADEPPPALYDLAADTGASLAYTAAAGWHLIADPDLLARVAEVDAQARRSRPARRPARRRRQRPSGSAAA